MYEQGVVFFDKWNEPKDGSKTEIVFVSRYSNKPNPDSDFIDLDALLRNVCIEIRNERRIFDKFNRKYEEQI